MQITRKSLTIGLMTAAGALAAWFLWQVRGGLYPFAIAFLLAYVLNPAVDWLVAKGLRRGWAIAILYLALFSVVIVGGSRLIPLLVRDLESFGRELPMMTAKGEELLYAIQWQYQHSALPPSLRVSLDQGLASLQAAAQGFVTSVVDAILGLLGHTIGLMISPVLAFYLLHDWHELSEAALGLLPARWRQEAVMVGRDIDKVLAGVIRGQLTVAVIVGLLVSLGLHLMGVRFALIIGILAGLLDVIPYFGAFIGAAPAVTVALLESPLLALKVVLLFFLIHQTEGTIIGPKILGENVNLHPLTVIFCLFVGEEIAGLAGMLLGVPVAGIAKVLCRHLLRMLV
jgi:predicted PurR-regulated permease PerM